MQPVATQRRKSDTCIDLAIGQPDPDLLPVDFFQGLSASHEVLAYGAERGLPALLEALAAWLTQQLGVVVDEATLMATNGSSNALDMMCTQFARPGDVVLVEDPTYFIARRLFQEHGLRVISVPMDNHGVCPAALARQIAEHKPAFFYTVASFHNPSGITTSLSRRQAVIDLARQTNCLVVSDDIYQLLYFDQPPPLPLPCLDTHAPVVSIGSFSKILAPGLRLGWIQANARVLKRLTTSALLDSGGGLNPFTAAMVVPLLKDGRLSAHLEMLRQCYRARSQTLLQTLHESSQVPKVVSEPRGGFFQWLACPGIVLTDKLVGDARALGVGFLPGSRCSDSSEAASAMRLCFAFYDESALRTAAQRLGQWLDRCSSR